MGRWGVLALLVIVALGAQADFEVYFLRHGETFWNRAKILQGSVSDTVLTRRALHLAEGRPADAHTAPAVAGEGH